MKKGCVISGGGSMGAFGAGTLAALNNKYDYIAGVSTGALMAPLVGTRDWDNLKEAYTSIKNSNIFDTKFRMGPFNRDGSINYFNVVLKIINQRRTLGETHNLRKLIDKFITEDIYAKLQKQNTEVIVTALNVVEQEIYAFSSKKEKHNDFKDWMWASANAPVFTTLMGKEYRSNNGLTRMGEWVDGGIIEFLPLNRLIVKGCDEIDVIIHEPKNYKPILKKSTNIITHANNLMSVQKTHIRETLLNASFNNARNKGIRLNIYWLPRKLTNNLLMFNKKTMLKWWDEGYETANDPARIDKY